MNMIKLTLMVVLSSALVACGGGSGNSNSSPNTSSSGISSSQPASSIAASSESSATESSQSSAESSADSSEASSSDAASESSSSAGNDNGWWSVYDGNLHPATDGAVVLESGATTAFTVGGTEGVDHFSSVGDGTLSFDSSAVAANSNHATLRNVVRNDGVYPKHLTLIAGIRGHSDNLRVIELEMAMGDEGAAGSRLKALLRNDGSNKGVQLEQALPPTSGSARQSVNSYGLDMSGFRIYQFAVTLTDANTGSVKVYADGSNQTLPNLSLDGVNMRPTAVDGDNFIRFGDGGSSAYKANVDWIIWTDAGAFTPAEVSGLLPANLGCVYNYGESDDLATCANPPVSSSSSSSSDASNSSSNGENSSNSSESSSSSGNTSSNDNGSGNNSSSGNSSSNAGNGGGNSSEPAIGTLSCTDANTVQGFASLDGGVTGGSGGTYVVAKTGADIVAALASKKNNATPLTIYINGTITPDNSGTNQFDVKDMNNVSIIGVGSAGLFDGIGINIVRANNIIVRNITIRYVRIGQKDHISIDNNSRNIWIDHNEFYNSLEVGKDYYDELVSGKGDIDKITLSYNHFHDSWKTSLWGSGDGNSFHRRISYIGNYWERVNSRLPLFRFGEGHILNNYYVAVRESGINSRMGASIRVEANHFEDSKNVLISMDSSTHGFWNATGNVLKNIEWGTFPAGNCTSSKGCVWGGQPGTTQTGGEFGVFPNAAAGAVSPSTYDPRDTAGYVVLNPVHDNGNDEIKNHVIANAGVGRLTRECLGVPADIVEGETGGGTAPEGGGSSGSGEGNTDGGNAIPVAGGWTAQAMKLGGSTAAISGSVVESSETEASFSIAGGKFESAKESFFFISKVVAGDFIFTANLAGWNTATRSGSDQGSVGLMMCVECENGGAAESSAKIGLRDNGILHTQRLASSANLGKATITPAIIPGEQLYLRITRAGNVFAVSYSVDGGNSFTVVRTNTFTNELPEDIHVGLYAAQGTNDANSFVFENISLETFNND